MTNENELKTKFWKALESDRTVMLGMPGLDHSHTRPMTAQVDEDESGDIWFFTATDNEIAKNGRNGEEAFFTFASKGHDIFAMVHGAIEDGTTPENVDRLWNRFVAAWYEGKDDPKLVLLRFRPREAHIWADASSIVAGIKMLLGIDPKQDYKDKEAKVRL